MAATFFIGLFIGAAFAGGTARAFAESVSPADDVVVRVNGQAITRSDMNAAFEQLPVALRSLPKDKIERILIKSLIDTKLVATAARAQGLDKTEAFRRRLARISEQLLERMYMAKLIGEKVGSRALHERYQAFVKTLRAQKEVRARHILVKTQKKAREIIALLDKGENFADLARKFSLDSTAAGGGELGFFPLHGVDKAFADAVAALKVGAYTRTAVKTGYGWHVILLEERRPRPIPGFAAVRDRLDREMSREVIDARIIALRGAVKIESPRQQHPKARPGPGRGAAVSK
ncbi:peptidylprolyl isomerase [Varunaivibrio sulfuroxidans]|uniref:peptidylprolyl isomerase n=1 Tax=Varunaivibrio sulfuroxidans TaxID=1773489 RepID=UPI0014055A6D|nr:peptidylprolyl isomerase [Varunaivibrio sulfuroxidans]WES30358.1 peptidylprolyl isomerase [Varunaivibrio sulfuroxidans]